MLETLLNILAPHSCVECNTQGDLICDMCIVQKVKRVPSRCFLCLEPTIDYKVCSVCRGKTVLDSLYVVSEYNGAVKKLIHAYKYEHKRAAARSMSSMVCSLIQPIPNDTKTVIVYVPTAFSHVRERGFDHAKRLALNCSTVLGLNIIEAIARNEQTVQHGSSRTARLQNAKTAYRLVPYLADKLYGKHVLLIDDVLTTGATLCEVAKLLNEAGVESVCAAVVAQSSPKTKPHSVGL